MASATLEFNQQLLPQSLLEIEQIGDCAIEAWNQDQYYYYMVIKTSLGTTTICTFGPIVPDVGLIPSGCSCTLNRMPYKEDKLTRTINIWLNDRNKALTDAHIIDFNDALDQFRDLGEYMRNYSEENY